MMTQLFLTWLHFKRKTSNYAREDITERISEHRNEAEARPAPHRPRQTARKGERNSQALTAGPSPQCSTLPTAAPGAKERTGVTSSTPSIGGSPLGSPALVSPHGNHRASVGSSTGNLTVTDNGRRGFPPAARGSWRTELLPAEHTQEAQPAACSAAAQLAGTVWPGNSGGAQVCLIRAFK